MPHRFGFYFWGMFRLSFIYQNVLSMKNTIYGYLLLLLLCPGGLFAQAVSINTDGSSPDPSTILDVKSTVRGLLAPRLAAQLDALQEWRDERLEHAEAGAHDPHGLHAMSDALQVRTSDLVGHIQRVLSHARRLESSVESAVQLHFSATAHRTNEIVRTLTAITAVFMPLTLITGIFGMNFEFIPGLHSPSGFWWALGAMATIGVLLIALFRARAMLSASTLFSQQRRRARRTASRAAPGAGKPSGNTPAGG